MSKICHVVGAGDFDPALLSPEKEDLIIAADAGLRHLQTAGISPHLYVGDGDSLGFQPQGLDTVVLPKVKDDTDTLAALREGLSRGYRRFYLYGALGGSRFSHSIANVQTLAFLSSLGAEGTLVDSNCRVSLLTASTRNLQSQGGYFSLFAYGGEAVVTVEGAKYPLKEATLSPQFPLGVSNEVQGLCSVTVHSGSVLLIEESFRP
jgi:thiamine pyrophosphokinase